MHSMSVSLLPRISTRIHFRRHNIVHAGELWGKNSTIAKEAPVQKMKIKDMMWVSLQWNM